MSSTVKSVYANYWKTSLLDSDSGKGAFNTKQLPSDFKQCTISELNNGIINQRLLNEFFADLPGNVQTVNLILRPMVYLAKFFHGKAYLGTRPETVTPVIVHACLDRDGKIYPTHTFIARDLLEPLDRGSFSISNIEALDTFLTRNSFPDFKEQYEVLTDTDQTKEQWFKTKWQEFVVFYQHLFNTVVAEDILTTQYDLAEFFFVLKEDTPSPSMHIRALYADIIEKQPITPLLDNFSFEKPTKTEPCAPPNSLISQRLSHSGDQHSLAKAQRDALTHLLLSKEGEILAVNGPPGTGKTTLLLSVVACLWAEAAIKGSNPSLIFVASTNNQAVTNVIEAFEKDFAKGTGPFSGRWLPDISSFGSYFPAKKREDELADQYQTTKFFNRIEEIEYVNKAQHFYIEKAKAALTSMADYSLEAIVAELQNRIGLEANKLKDVEQAWNALQAARDELYIVLETKPLQALHTYRRAVETALMRVQRLNEFEDAWDVHLAQEPLYLSLFSWIPPVNAKRLLLAKKLLKKHFEQTFDSIPAVTKYLSQEIVKEKNILTQHQDKYAHVKSLVKALLAHKSIWQKTLSTQAFQLGKRPSTLNEYDELADKTIRFHIFLLTTHYWEGRWLQEMSALLQEYGNSLDAEKRKTGETSLKKRWYRRMMITPCAVSTFFMLPKELKASRHNEGKFDDHYLYNFADLLIVDEAGQVLPEVAGASFSLAKRSLVIGDTRQIEPIWAISRQIDSGNLIKNNLLAKNYDEQLFEQLADSGKLASSGSVMRIAQHATRFHYDKDLDRGMYLFEHHRCFDEIIQYCDELCYSKKLIPKRGPSQQHEFLPAMGYLHVDGACQNTSGSRKNDLEAETIAEWVSANKSRLEKQYKNKSLKEIIGIVAPFTGQVAAIINACKKRGIEATGPNGIVVGTVHSFQGSERPVIIFSPTYSKHSNGQFIDVKKSMLNVAVSRAKDSFMVFGDMDTFDSSAASSPRGLLARYLFKNEKNAMAFKQFARQDLKTSKNQIKQLINAEEHDDFLIETIKRSANEILIVTPWLLAHSISAEVMKVMQDATKRGVAITVYTDQKFNEKRLSELAQAISKLAEIGVKTVLVKNVHSKVLICDDLICCVGSFNWFSADRHGQFKNHETSFAYTGHGLSEEIQILKKDLHQRAI